MFERKLLSPYSGWKSLFYPENGGSKSLKTDGN
jgi:hypothetical protein